ncbi:MAG: acetylornithine deacetylase [Gammaproteobacteria bacterium]|nr:MAG: acetylornithine deacetylase [Gammaproteobacteria bacterium]
MSAAAFDMIAKLVGFATVSRDSNLALIEYVSSYLAEHGVDSRLVPNAGNSKANLFATIGPMVEGGVVLSGHTDVVPVDGQPWASDPFSLTENNGRLYGRGTADMKSFYAIALALVPEMLERGLARPIHLALSYDEEIGCLGAPAMIERMAAELPAPRAVVVGEPTDMRIVTAHKSITGLETVVTGHEAHSSQTHRGVSAVMTAARLITFLEDMARENAARPASQTSFEPPYSTIHVGTVGGGTATNIISRECRFGWDMRCIPEDDPQTFLDRFDRYCRDKILPGMQAVAPGANIVTTLRCSVPALRPESNGQAEALVRTLTGYNSSDAVAYAAEAGQFQQAGFSTVLCGPGSIDQAHQPNEYIEKSQVHACVDFMRRLIDAQAS